MSREINLVRALSALTAILLLTSIGTAQGQFDPTFGSGGAAALTIPANENVVGADAQDTNPLTDKIIVATSKPGIYMVRRFHQSTGALDITFGGGGVGNASVGGTASAGAIAVKNGGSMIYVAGQGSSSTICTVVRFSANGISPLIKNVPLPTPFNFCSIGSAQIQGGKLYISGLSFNPGNSKQGLTTIRFNLPSLAVDTTWGASGVVRTEVAMPGSSITVWAGLAFDASKVYVAGRLNAPASLSGTMVVGYNLSNGQVVSSGFGDRNLSLTPGSGVFVVSGLVGEDMINAGGKLYLNGRVTSQAPDNFGLVKLTLPATTSGSLTTYPGADLQVYDRGYKLIMLDANNVISGGQSNVPPSNRTDIGLAKYSTATTSLTGTWYPRNLQILQIGVPPPVFSVATGIDLRRINTGPADELLLKAFVIPHILESRTGLLVPDKLVIVAQKHNAAGRQIWIGRIGPF